MIPPRKRNSFRARNSSRIVPGLARAAPSVRWLEDEARERSRKEASLAARRRALRRLFWLLLHELREAQGLAGLRVLEANRARLDLDVPLLDRAAHGQGARRPERLAREAVAPL